MCFSMLIVFVWFVRQVHGLKDFKPMVLQHRGPDCGRNVSKLIAPGICAVFCGTVLHFRGLLAVQPLECNGNVLLWNGEAFGGLQVAHSLCFIKFNLSIKS